MDEEEEEQREEIIIRKPLGIWDLWTDGRVDGGKKDNTKWHKGLLPRIIADYSEMQNRTRCKQISKKMTKNNKTTQKGALHGAFGLCGQ